MSSGPYNAAALAYTDPNDAAFHPLGTELYSATRLEESVLLTDGSLFLEDVRRDDQLNGATVSDWMPGLAGNERRRCAAAGDLRGDGTMQIVTIEGFGATRLRIWERTSSGAYAVIQSERLPSWADLDLTCADVDGDGRDEIACGVFKSSSSQRHEVWIIDDLVDGPWGTATTMPLMDWRILGTGGNSSSQVKIAAADLDSDVREELFVALQISGFSADIYAIDDLAAGLATIASDSVLGQERSEGLLICAADTDGNGIDELVVSGSRQLMVEEISGQTFTNRGNVDTGSQYWFGLVGFDREGTGRDEVGYVRVERFIGGPFAPIELDVAEFRSIRRQGSSNWTVGATADLVGSMFGSSAQVVRGAELVALEDDNDGREEVRGVLGWDTGSNQLVEFRFEDSDTTYIEQRSVINDIDTFFIVAGEDDRETSMLRYTGQKELHLAAPLPIVVMEAVPTKSGILQNYGQSGSTFSNTSGSSTSYSTTSAVSFGITGGFTSPSLFGLFEAEATTTITGTITDTVGSADSVRTFTTYASAADVHSIVFQGTLYHSYLYEVMRSADPLAIGSTVALNVPVATNEWKWTLDTYNSAFPGRRIRPELVFAHSGGTTTIGDPTSYPSQNELEGYVTGPSPLFDGWVGGSSTAGEGTAFNGFGLSLGNISTTSTERTLAVDIGVQFAAAGTVFGASYGLSSGSVFTVETSRETEYQATIGDISTADYPDWNYTAGMVVHKDRTSGEYPFQVIRYWVDPTGTAYP